MYDPFALSDALIRDLPHVRVIRHAPGEGRRCTYEKTFKPDGLPEADYWTQRENAFLLDFARQGLRHTVELAQGGQDSGGGGESGIGKIATYDAGVTLEDWLRVRPGYAGGEALAHPFQPVGQFFRLLRACLYALREIHKLGIAHCDFKPENICLPYAPAGEQGISIDFERVRLIDFAFAVTPDRPLERPLPLQPTAAYQSPELRQALRADQKPLNGFAAQTLTWQVDFYSLGHLAVRIVRAGLVPPPGATGLAALRAAHDLAPRLQDYGKLNINRMPHNSLIAELNGWLEQLADGNQPFRRLPPPTPGAAMEDDDDEALSAAPMPLIIDPTPVTLIAPSVAPKPGRTWKWKWTRRSKSLVLSLGALGLAVAGGGYATLHAAKRPGAKKPGAASPAAPAAAPADPLENANKLYKRKEYGQALPIYQRLADAGNAAAQSQLGLMYELGLGVAKDEAWAIQWYGKAAEQGNAAGQASLGWMYAQGLGVEKDEVEAVAWYRNAALQGNPRGQSNLGWMYEHGKGGLAKDEAQAADWYRKAAEQGYGVAQYNLGIFYKDGRGVAKDEAKAMEWFGSAAGKGHAGALAELTRLFEQQR